MSAAIILTESMEALPSKRAVRLVGVVACTSSYL